MWPLQCQQATEDTVISSHLTLHQLICELNPDPVRLVRDIETGRASKWFLDRAGWRGFSRDKHLLMATQYLSQLLMAPLGPVLPSLHPVHLPPPRLPPPAAKRKLIVVSVHSFLFKPLTSIKNRPSVILGTQPTNHYIASRHQVVSSKMPNSWRSFYVVVWKERQCKNKFEEMNTRWCFQ